MFSISACAFPPVPLLVSYHDSVSSCFPPTNLKLGLTPWMNGVSAGTIRQTFATVPGQAYQLSFCYANNPDGPAQSATATVSVTGASPRLNWNISHAGSTPSQMNYTRFLGTFIVRLDDDDVAICLDDDRRLRDRPDAGIGDGRGHDSLGLMRLRI